VLRESGFTSYNSKEVAIKERMVIDAPVIPNVDVLVCGGGPAGIGAAVAAARQGARTMLIEGQGCLGGTATNALVGVWLGSYSRDGAYPVVGGIFTEIVNRLVKNGDAIRASEDVIVGSRHVGYATWHGRTVPFEFEPCKQVCEQLALDAGVNLRYFTHMVYPQVEKGQITGVFLYSKNGMEFLEANMVVDATGDADVAFRAGCRTVKGRLKDGLMSPATLIFVVEDVDSYAFERYCKRTGDVRLRSVITKLKNQDIWPFSFDVIIACEMPRRGRFFINTLRLTGIDGTDPKDLTRGMIEGRRQARKLLEVLRRNVPGFEKARLVQTSSMLGIRDTRRIVGEYEVSIEDITQGRHYDDTIALSGYQWDMADPTRPSYQRMEGVKVALPYAEIPYRSLLPQGITNLIVAGRCMSANWDALGPLRIMPACFAMGEAAGNAAALALSKENNARCVNIALLQDNLLKQGAIVAPPLHDMEKGEEEKNKEEVI